MLQTECVAFITNEYFWNKIKIKNNCFHKIMGYLAIKKIANYSSGTKKYIFTVSNDIDERILIMT